MRLPKSLNIEIKQGKVGYMLMSCLRNPRRKDAVISWNEIHSKKNNSIVYE